ncbi:Hypothetical protein GLP15_1691 [Giardia lamblia P15]|uniref:Tr-type G domain-containing protein n=1 Tax=Giardia intestinalis (strain P15) TaxID=658858 RepID=E1EW11_GIAIA|nr:Hypothetical protein GLP15_1691 [Giardia lamblia P15]
MISSSYSTLESTSDSFVQINEEDVVLDLPTVDLQVSKYEPHSTRGEWNIRPESELNLQLYAAGRTATIGIFGPNQSGKTTLVTYLSQRTTSSISASASKALNHGLKRTVFVEAWRGYCKVSRNNASPTYAIFFIDTPGHPQQLPESVSICSRLRTIILLVNLCAGLQSDHNIYLTALEERSTIAHDSSYNWSLPTCIMAFSNVDKFCYAELSQVRKKGANQCCLVQYVALRLRLQIEVLEATLCREYPWLKDSLAHQILLCYYNCLKTYCLVSVQRLSSDKLDTLVVFESIVSSLLNGTEFTPEDLMICMPKCIPDKLPIAITSEHLRRSFLCCCPYKLCTFWSAYIFYTPSELSYNESQWRELLGVDALGPLIEDSDGSLKRLSTISTDTIFMILISPQDRDDSVVLPINSLNQKSIFYPYVTHTRVSISLTSDALQLSTYFSGLSLQPTHKPNVLEIRTRGEYTLNLFLSILYLVAQKSLTQKPLRQEESVIQTLPLLPVLSKRISHTSQKPTQLKVYLDESRGMINFTISVLLRESPPPKIWGYVTGLQKRNELLATLDPHTSVYDQIATLYANNFYSIIDGTMHYNTVNVSEGSIVLSSRLTHSSTLVEALKEAISREAESSLIPFYNLQIVVLDYKCYQKTHYIHLHASTLLTNAIGSSKLQYVEPLLYTQMFVSKGLYRTKKEQSFLNNALEKLKCLLCSRRCIFKTDPWIQMACPISSFAAIFFYIPAGSALGLELAIERILRCTSVNVYHSKQIYFVRTVDAILDPDDLKGTIDAMKSRSNAFNRKEYRV